MYIAEKSAVNNNGIVIPERRIFVSKRGNAIIIHGGGLVDPSKVILMRLANNLQQDQVYDKIYLGRYSFESLYTPEFHMEYNWRLVENLKDKRGCYFGTCRGIDLTEPILCQKAIECLKSKNISTVIVAGGDGSSRQVAEISDIFMEEGINFIFAIPLTIDGINGGDSVGLKQAVRESVRQIENIAATSLETRDNGRFGVVAVELQGRNRDDIISNVLRTFVKNRCVADRNLNEILLRVVPANMQTNFESLLDEVNQTSARTLLLISEGAEIKMESLTKRIDRKVRCLTIGHSSQSNGMTTKEDEHEYGLWIDQITSMISKNPHECFSVVRKGHSYRKETIDYYAKLNPREGQVAKLKNNLNELLNSYMAM